MGSLFMMAWRNLGRHRGRTILSLLAVFCGVLFVILFKGMIDGMLDSMISYNINLNSGHVRIIRPDYEAKEKLLSLAYPVGEKGRSASELLRGIRRLSGVETATGRIRFGMMLVRGETNETVLGIGTDLKTEDKISHLSVYLTGQGAGRLPKAGRQEILLGKDLLRKLHLKVGDKVNAIFSTSLGSFKVATLTVAGKMASGLKMLDDGTAYIPLDQAMKLTELPDMVTEIVAFGKDPGNAPNLAGVIRSYLKTGEENLKVVSWNKYNDYIVMLEKVQAVYNLFYIFMLVLASFVVLNTLMMVVAERTREIGMLSALGMSPKEIRRLFLDEGFIIAVLGSLAGTVIGGSLNGLLSRTGIDVSRAMDMMPKDITMLPRMYPSNKLSVLVFSFLLGVGVTMLAVYLPARQAASLKPAEALRTI